MKVEAVDDAAKARRSRTSIISSSVPAGPSARTNSWIWSSMPSRWMTAPPAIAMTSPTTVYMIAICGPKMLMTKTREARSTMGEEMRNENVTPSGSPARVNAMNSGMELQAQNGVTVPSRAPMTLPAIPLKRPRMRLLRSGGKKLCT